MQIKKLTKEEAGRVMKGLVSALSDFVKREDLHDDFIAFLDDRGRDYGFRFVEDGIELLQHRDGDRRD
jgi:hypothetical protein